MAHGEPDPEVVSAVAHVRDSFGVPGLRDLVRLGQAELVRAERALAQGLGDAGEDAGDADARAWQAFRDTEPPELDDDIPAR